MLTDKREAIIREYDLRFILNNNGMYYSKIIDINPFATIFIRLYLNKKSRIVLKTDCYLDQKVISLIQIAYNNAKDLVRDWEATKQEE